MSFFIYFFIIVVGIVALICIVGLLLPNERTATSECYYNASPEKVYNALTNNADCYRSDLEKVVIIEENDGIEVWDEIAKNGSVIRFRTANKQPYSLYEFDIIRGTDSPGRLEGELKSTSTGGTHFTSTETIRIKTIKLFSYLFFDPEKSAHT